jgi:hypothetical protein
MNTNNTNNENKPHPHAEIVHAWADGAKIQVKKDNGEWEYCDFPLWNEKIEYRIKPSNEPWSPKPDEKYFYLDVFHGEFCVVDITWNSTDTDYALRRNNNIFPTKADAEAAIHRVKAALKAEIRDKVMSREEAYCAIIDKSTSLLRENNKLKEELESFITRCEYLQKSKEQLIASHAAVDGVTLTNGEIALIKALRRVDRITDVYDYRTTVLVSANDNSSMVDSNRQHISFFTSASDSDDELIIAALKQIKAEQEASNEAE